MGVYARKDSPVWWIYLEPTDDCIGQREATKFRIGTTTTQKRDSKQAALDLYHARMLKRGKAAQEPEPPPAVPTFNVFADWYDTHEIPKHAASGQEREREILPRLRATFGEIALDQITKKRVIEWRTDRLTTGTVVERFGLTSGTPAVWRQVHALLQVEGPMTLRDIRARFPVSTRDVCSTLTSNPAAKPFFRRVKRGVWTAIGQPKAYRQVYAPPNPRTVNREVDVLQQILAAAVEAGHLSQSPLYGLANLNTVDPIRRTMSEAEETAISEHLALDDHAIMVVGLDTLARMIDILDLKWTDLHLTRGKYGQLDIRDPKNGQSITVPMSARVRAALLALPRPKGAIYCFPRRRTGASYAARRTAVARALRKACRAADVPYGRVAQGITFHWSTRRTGATRMIQRGGEKAIAVVKRIGGWKTTGVLLGIYQETITDEMEAAVESVSAQLGASFPQAGGAKTRKVIHAVFTQK